MTYVVKDTLLNPLFFFIIVEVNSSGKFIYTQIMNKNVNQTQTTENYVKTRGRKNHGAKRDIFH